MSVSGKLYKKIGFIEGSTEPKWALREFTFDPTNRYLGSKSDTGAFKWSIKVSDKHKARAPHTNDPEDTKSPFAIEVRGYKIVGDGVDPLLRK